MISDLVAVAREFRLLDAVPKDIEKWAREFLDDVPPQLVGHPTVVRCKAKLNPPTIVDGQKLRWVSTRERWEAFAALKAKLPAGITGVAGVARSGLSSAVELAMEWHIQPYMLSLKRCERIDGGWRFKRPPKDDGMLLVLDDTLASGQSIERLRPKIDALRRTRDVVTAAIFSSPGASHLVDLIGAELPLPHLLEWNFCNSIHSDRIALDFDGVLCAECPCECDDDGPRYLEFLRDAQLRWAFRLTEIPLIVTARLERYRPETEAWLTKHRMRVRKLVMGDWTSKAERARSYRAGEFKGREYAASKCKLFVESCPIQSREIFEATGRPVLCAQTGEIWQS